MIINGEPSTGLRFSSSRKIKLQLFFKSIYVKVLKDFGPLGYSSRSKICSQALPMIPYRLRLCAIQTREVQTLDHLNLTSNHIGNVSKTDSLTIGI